MLSKTRKIERTTLGESDSSLYELKITQKIFKSQKVVKFLLHNNSSSFMIEMCVSKSK